MESNGLLLGDRWNTNGLEIDIVFSYMYELANRLFGMLTYTSFYSANRYTVRLFNWYTVSYLTGIQ